jgi:hypothetical protein
MIVMMIIIGYPVSESGTPTSLSISGTTSDSDIVTVLHGTHGGSLYRVRPDIGIEKHDIGYHIPNTGFDIGPRVQ